MLMSVKECASYLGVSTKTVYRWCESGYLPHARLGSWMLRFDKQTIDNWVKEKQRTH